MHGSVATFPAILFPVFVDDLYFLKDTLYVLPTLWPNICYEHLFLLQNKTGNMRLDKVWWTKGHFRGQDFSGIVFSSVHLPDVYSVFHVHLPRSLLLFVWMQPLSQHHCLNNPFLLEKKLHHIILIKYSTPRYSWIHFWILYFLTLILLHLILP